MKTLREDWGKLQPRILQYLSAREHATVRDLMRFLSRSYWDSYITLEKLTDKGLVEKLRKRAGKTRIAFKISDAGLNYLLSLDFKEIGQGYEALATEMRNE